MKTGKMYLCAAAMAALMATSCTSPKEVLYFQDLKAGQQVQLQQITPIRFQPNDRVSITVSTGDSRLNTMFNLAVPRQNLLGGNSEGLTSESGSDNQMASYLIDSKGDITFPTLGRLHIAGMTREELAEYIRRELVSRDLAKNPIVTVDYLNLGVTVLGDVSSPGRKAITREDFSIVDAVAAAGDLQLSGKRENIKVIREENGVQRVYEVNMKDGRALTQSPVYYLRQNDIIYVEPNSTKARSIGPNGNAALTPGFWFSMVSFAITIGTLVVTITK